MWHFKIYIYIYIYIYVYIFFFSIIIWILILMITSFQILFKFLIVFLFSHQFPLSPANHHAISSKLTQLFLFLFHSYFPNTFLFLKFNFHHIFSSFIYLLLSITFLTIAIIFPLGQRVAMAPQDITWLAKSQQWWYCISYNNTKNIHVKYHLMRIHLAGDPSEVGNRRGKQWREYIPAWM